MTAMAKMTAMPAEWNVMADISRELDMVIRSYDAVIVKITDLPEAFKHVRETLPIVQLLFPRIHPDRYDGPPTSNPYVLQRCEDSAKQLASIFRNFATGIQKDGHLKSWVDAQHLYRDVVGENKSNLVETLMMTFLMAFQCLISISASDEASMPSSKALIAKLTTSMARLSSVAPSLGDPELDDTALRFQQIIRDQATGFVNQSFRSSGSTVNNITGDFISFSTGGTYFKNGKAGVAEAA